LADTLTMDAATIEEAHRRIAGVQADLARARSLRDQLARRLDEERFKRGELAAEYDRVRARLHDACQTVDGLTAELDDVLSSTSWRATAPLRAATGRWRSR
jgi:hypothetical protein